ncbi:hypothetical protein HDU76_001748 [Blyttiomyces sp. JEL0837]|nr:hypothetical protein HDU76_001748 [Blyttiomyces sp. JEL0837]
MNPLISITQMQLAAMPQSKPKKAVDNELKKPVEHVAAHDVSNNGKPRRVAIIGSGISGLSAAWLLAQEPSNFKVTLFESADYFGGHTHTVDVPSLTDPEKKVGVDTGFIVCNPVTYPNFLNFLTQIQVPIQKSDMSFSVSRNQGEFEWAGDNLNTVFAQRSNLLPIGHGQEGFGMYGLIYEITRFHKQAAEIAAEADDLQFGPDGKVKDGEGIKAHPYAKMTLGEFFKKFNYSKFFYQNYVLPMTAAIWSTPADMTFDKFPLLTLVRFMRNHIMLQIGGRPKWRTVLNGSRNYVEKVLESIEDKRLNTPVKSIKRVNGVVKITDGKTGKTEEFDHVIFATHSDQALKILGEDASSDERKILGAIKFVDNKAVLHRDPTLMPKRRLAWSSWNYITDVSDETSSQSMCLTYYMNRLQPYIDTEAFGDVFVTMNPLRKPDPATVLGEWEYTHPLYSPETIAAQDNLNTIQNVNLTTFAGAWTNYGFHEDGVTSGLLAAISLGATCPFPVTLNGGYPTHRESPPPPSWASEKGVSRHVVERPLYVTKEDRENAMKMARDSKPMFELDDNTLTYLFGIGAMSGSEVFETYQREYSTLHESIKQKITSAIPNAPQGEQKKLLINQCLRELEEADEIISQMETELVSLPGPVRASLQPRVKAFKEEIKKAKKDMKQGQSERDQLLSSGSHVVDFDGVSLDQRSRLLQGTERLQESSRRLEEAKRVALETESAGINTLSELNSQREQILRTRDRLQNADSWITKSQGVLRNMQTVMYQNKALTYSIIGALILLILIVVWFKFLA